MEPLSVEPNLMEILWDETARSNGWKGRSF